MKSPFQLPPIDLTEALSVRHPFRIGGELLAAFREKCKTGGYPLIPDEQFRRLVAEWLTDGCQLELFPQDKNLNWDLDLEATMDKTMYPRMQPSLLLAYEQACASLPEKASARSRKLIARWVMKKGR